ncbi:MAG: Zeta toxin family protein [Candidatus Kapabacteria bacterium]|nr:Zeta toxin family protein [Candidatus Kapabacteria bacterium]
MHEEGMTPPYIILVAGPNGVGKSTFAKWYLQRHPDCSVIVDPDAIARELGDAPELERNITAGRKAVMLIEQLIEQRRSFAIETTLSGKTLSHKLEFAQAAGYTIAIIVLWIPSVRLSAERVRSRVAGGGHDIPEDIQIRRFERTYINFFELYESRCHEWSLYYAVDRKPREIASGRGGFSKK